MDQVKRLSAIISAPIQAVRIWLSPRAAQIFSSGGTIGGTSAGAANVFGFNSTAGLQIAGQNNVVIGNLFGTNPSRANLGNAIGVTVGGQSNTIGGASAGAANVFGFNSTEGLEISGSGASANVVLGNFFGTDASGANLGNLAGLIVESGSNTIGGASPGAGNVFGFSGNFGAALLGAAGSNNVVLGNFFGTDSRGDAFSNNVDLVVQSASNTIGGVSTGSANTFAFSELVGLQLETSGATNNLVIGNDFGINPAGDKLHLTNGLVLGGPSNTIGGTTPGSGNVFALASVFGLQISGPIATNNVVLGNFFGTNSSGANLGNQVGLDIECASNTVGGTAPGAANVFAFSKAAGIQIEGQFAGLETVIGNFIGTNAAGAKLANAVGLDIESVANTIGGSAAGAGNVISFNSNSGIQISGAAASYNFLLGNVISSNGTSGVEINGPGTSNNVLIGNVIGLNSISGVEISGSGVSNNLLLGNFIGTDATGQVANPNDIGVLISGGTSNVIGAPGAGNVISGNFTAGIKLDGSSVTGTQIVGNRIGTNLAGTDYVLQPKATDQIAALQDAGIAIIGSGGNTVGGTGLEANVISGNYVGINLANITSAMGQNVVVGNLIGTNAAGNAAVSNIVGVYINSAAGNQIGAPGSPNTISGNTSVGVEIYGDGSTANVVESNIIGLDSNGHKALMKNRQFIQETGVFIYNASNNSIGGSTPGTGNVVSGNQNVGVYVFSDSGGSSRNTIQSNLIGLAQGGGAGPGNNGYGVVLFNAPSNQVRRTGARANRFGRNRIANFRTLADPTAMTSARSRARATTHGSHPSTAHPRGPVHHFNRRKAH